jgi:Holliday junction resolvasome RuvABC ATP-dependent DNA helicase subunit
MNVSHDRIRTFGEQKCMPDSLGDTYKDIQEREKAAFSALTSFDQLVGQQDCVERLRRFGESFALGREISEHVLIAGGGGTGKRSLARAFAKAFNSSLIEIDGKFLRLGDLYKALTSCEAGGALLISKLHKLSQPLAEELQKALQRFQIDLEIGRSGSLHPFMLNRFTLLATVPRIDDVPSGLSRSFGLSLTIQPYSNEELKQITTSLATKLGIKLEEPVATMLINVGHRSPGSLERMLKRFTRLGVTTINLRVRRRSACRIRFVFTATYQPA